MNNDNPPATLSDFDTSAFTEQDIRLLLFCTNMLLDLSGRFLLNEGQSADRLLNNLCTALMVDNCSYPGQWADLLEKVPFIEEDRAARDKAITELRALQAKKKALELKSKLLAEEISTDLGLN